MPQPCTPSCHLFECSPLLTQAFLLCVIMDLESWNKWLRYPLNSYRAACCECTCRRQRPSLTRTGLIRVCDYAWHVQSASGDVINLFQQETDACVSHSRSLSQTHKHSRTHVCCHGDKDDVTVSQKQRAECDACNSVIILSRIFTFQAHVTAGCTSMRSPTHTSFSPLPPSSPHPAPRMHQTSF